VPQQVVPPNILVIEDNSADVVLLRVALDRIGEDYVLQVLRDGDEAMNFIEDHRAGRRGPEPCVIVLDLHLPRHDGLEILREIKNAPALSHIRVVILTSLASPTEELGVVSLGGTFVEKPADLNGYLKLAEQLMELCRTTEAVAVS